MLEKSWWDTFLYTLCPKLEHVQSLSSSYIFSQLEILGFCEKCPGGAWVFFNLWSFPFCIDPVEFILGIWKSKVCSVSGSSDLDNCALTHGSSGWCPGKFKDVVDVWRKFKFFTIDLKKCRLTKPWKRMGVTTKSIKSKHLFKQWIFSNWKFIACIKLPWVLTDSKLIGLFTQPV